MSGCANPQSTVAIPKDACGGQGRRHAAKWIIDDFCARDVTQGVNSNQNASPAIALRQRLVSLNRCSQITGWSTRGPSP